MDKIDLRVKMEEVVSHVIGLAGDNPEFIDAIRMLSEVLVNAVDFYDEQSELLPENVMIMEKVESSNIERIGYLSSASVMDVVFKGGGRYRYFDVPEDVFSNLRKAESKGKYFHKYVKDMYSYARV